MKFGDLVFYDADNRGIRSATGFGYGLNAHSWNELADRLGAIGGELGRANWERSVCKELGELLRYRIIFLLIPEVCLFGHPPEDKPLIRSHLTKLGVEPIDDLVRAIKYICENFRGARLGHKKKLTGEELYIQNSAMFERILRQQNERCSYCGVIVRRGDNLQLDHIIPWYLANDPYDGSNWQFCCATCNRGKNRFPFYSLDRACWNWLEPKLEHRLTEPLRFAALCRDGECVRTGVRPREAELEVVKLIDSGCWVIDNVVTCVKHDSEQSSSATPGQ